MLKIVASVVCIVLAGGTTVLSLRDLRDHAGSFPVLREAERLSAGNRTSAGNLAISGMERLAADPDPSCRPVRDGAVADIALAKVLSIDPAADYEAWLAAVERAQGLFRHAIACAPTDGVAWVRLALVERMISLAPARTSRLLSLSYQLAPADPVALATRILLWRNLPAEIGAVDESVRRADIETVLQQAWPPEAAGLFRHPDPRLAKEIEADLATLPADRQRHLRTAGLLSRPKAPPPSAASGTIGDGLAQFMNRPPSW